MNTVSNIRSAITGRNRKVRRLARANAELDAVRSEYKKVAVRRTRRERVRNVMYGNVFGGGKITGGAKSPGGLSNSGMTRLFDHVELRRNMRDAMYDSPQARAIVTRFSDSQVDTGLKPRFEPNYDMLGITPEEANTWGRKVSSALHSYLLSKDSSADGVNNGYQNQHLYAMMQHRDNDQYVRFHYTRDKDLISPVQMQFLDPDQLVGHCYTSTNGMQQGLNGGIKYDSRGKEKSYTFIVFDEKTGEASDVEIPAMGSKSKRRYLIHCFRPEFAGQKQGYTLMAHLLQEFEDLTTLQAAHVQKAINQSSFGFYTKPGKDAPASGGPDDYANDASEVIEEFMNSGEIDGMSAEQLNSFTYNVMSEFTIRQPGTLWNTSLAGGEDMKAVEQTAPADKFAEFVESLLMNMCASTGMPIEVLLMKFGQNYSASRATLVLFWRILNVWRAEMEADFLNPWAKAWLSEEIAAGRISAPGWSDPRMRAAWMNIRWIGSSVPTIDPKKESEADMNRAILGQQTLDDGALRLNGSDGEKNRAQLRKEYEQLPVAPWMNQISSEPDSKDDDDEEKSDDKSDDEDE